MNRADRHNALELNLLDSGFGSLSRFDAAFRQLCGCSARQYRSLHRV